MTYAQGKLMEWQLVHSNDDALYYLKVGGKTLISLLFRYDGGVEMGLWKDGEFHASEKTLLGPYNPSNAKKIFENLGIIPEPLVSYLSYKNRVRRGIQKVHRDISSLHERIRTKFYPLIREYEELKEKSESAIWVFRNPDKIEKLKIVE